MLLDFFVDLLQQLDNSNAFGTGVLIAKAPGSIGANNELKDRLVIFKKIQLIKEVKVALPAWSCQTSDFRSCIRCLRRGSSRGPCSSRPDPPPDELWAWHP